MIPMQPRGSPRTRYPKTGGYQTGGPVPGAGGARAIRVHSRVYLEISYVLVVGRKNWVSFISPRCIYICYLFQEATKGSQGKRVLYVEGVHP